MSVTEYEDTDEQVISSGWMTAIAIVMIGLGLIAIAFPFFATIASTVLFGWIFIFAGIAQIAYTFQSKGAGKIAWKMILGFLYLLSGIFVMINPLEGAFAFTIVLGITIFLQGMIQVSLAFQMRWISPNWGWMLVSGFIGIIFGIFVWSSSPLSATWLIGTLIGINLLFDGIWMLTLHSGDKLTISH
ncbi:HdeD family acid-resistance protein [Pseudanabaena sp. 'Roaring Creek']|uniref:HdeD family acid-resistance protein n=1 Tax=Pseudanabaena sp. 'Roaring Creek' TaxID=1681830 RepID=UPI0006D77004|nr:DUF308 domain-containing protein [Pseudanabaena sp. 'Roaring Creek']